MTIHRIRLKPVVLAVLTSAAVLATGASSAGTATGWNIMMGGVSRDGTNIYGDNVIAYEQGVLIGDGTQNAIADSVVVGNGSSAVHAPDWEC